MVYRTINRGKPLLYEDLSPGDLFRFADTSWSAPFIRMSGGYCDNFFQFHNPNKELFRGKCVIRVHGYFQETAEPVTE